MVNVLGKAFYSLLMRELDCLLLHGSNSNMQVGYIDCVAVVNVGFVC